MKQQTGNMFMCPTDLLLVTTNSYVRTDGRLVMGRGAAKDMTRHYTTADMTFGALVDRHAHAGLYGVLIDPANHLPPWRDTPEALLDIEAKRTGGRRSGMSFYAPIRIGIFQVKYHWGKPAVMDLIEYSVGRLCEMLCESPMSGWSVSLNFPGIGNGGLEKEVVMPLVQRLPDNVTVWTK